MEEVEAGGKAVVARARQGAANRLKDFRQHVDGRADTVFHTPAVVRDHDGIDTRIGGELGVLEGKNALEHELDLDRIAQALDQVPGQVGDNRAADAAEIDSAKIRLAREVGVEAVAASALARVGTPKPDEGLP